MGYFADTDITFAVLLAFEGHHHPYGRNILKFHTVSPQAVLAEESRGPTQAAVAATNSTAGKQEKPEHSEKSAA